MATLRRGEVYHLPLLNKYGSIGELPFLVVGIRSISGEVDEANEPDWSRYAVSIEGLISFGIEEHSGCFVTTKYIFEHATPIECPNKQREARQLIKEWKEFERML